MLFIVVMASANFPLFSQDTGQLNDYEQLAVRQSAPPVLWSLVMETGAAENYDVDLTHLNPYYQRGDFDGDGNSDFAVLLRDKTDPNQTRFAVLTGAKKLYWMDRDEHLQYPTMEAWFVIDKDEPIQESPFAEGEPPVLIGEALMIIKLETSSSVVYWNGKRFVSYWQGD
jgi:hypothetical protein